VSSMLSTGALPVSQVEITGRNHRLRPMTSSLNLRLARDSTRIQGRDSLFALILIELLIAEGSR